MDISKFNLGVKGVQVRAVLTLSVQGCVGQEVAPPTGEVMTLNWETSSYWNDWLYLLVLGWGNEAFHGRHLNSTSKLPSVTLKQGRCWSIEYVWASSCQWSSEELRVLLENFRRTMMFINWCRLKLFLKYCKLVDKWLHCMAGFQRDSTNTESIA